MSIKKSSSFKNSSQVKRLEKFNVDLGTQGSEARAFWMAL